jgi:hypothetical protein
MPHHPLPPIKVMAEYQQIEYRILKDGSVQETVLKATGESCVQTTAEVEAALGTIQDRTLLPEYQQNEALVDPTTDLNLQSSH